MPEDRRWRHYRVLRVANDRKSGFFFCAARARFSDECGSGNIMITTSMGTATVCRRGWGAEHGRDAAAGCWSTVDDPYSVRVALKFVVWLKAELWSGTNRMSARNCRREWFRENPDIATFTPFIGLDDGWTRVLR